MRLLAQTGWGPERQDRQRATIRITRRVHILAPKMQDRILRGGSLTMRPKRPQKLLRLFDPQLYSITVAGNANFNVGLLSKYKAYFPEDPNDLPEQGDLLDDRRVAEIVGQTLEFQEQLGVTSLIAPNVMVPDRLDSVWGAIARKFIRQTGRIAGNSRNKAPVLATLCLGSETLNNRADLDDLLADLTGRGRKPDGFYVLFSFPDGEFRQHCTAGEFGAMLYVVYSLASNGFEVVVGYADYLATFFEMAGASSAATGWYENQKKFSISRFHPTPAFRTRPNPRYSSPALFNRILTNELIDSNMINELKSEPSYLREYRTAGGPSPTTQALQHWCAVYNTLGTMDSNDIDTGIADGLAIVQKSRRMYARLRGALLSIDPRSDDSHLAILSGGLTVFGELLNS